SVAARCAGLAHVTHVPHFLSHLMASATDASPLASKPSSFCSPLYRLVSLRSKETSVGKRLPQATLSPCACFGASVSVAGRWSHVLQTCGSICDEQDSASLMLAV